jgi:hypothetical protein
LTNLSVLCVDIAAEVKHIAAHPSNRSDEASPVFPAPVVLDVTDDNNCMQVLLMFCALSHSFLLLPSHLYFKGTSAALGVKHKCPE